MLNRHEYFNWSSLGFYEIQKSAEFGLPQPPNRTDLMLDMRIQLDGQDRFDAREAPWFRLVQPYQRHTAIPSDRYIYVYSFALRPEEQQPSGSLNASRIDTITFQMTVQSGNNPIVINTNGTSPAYPFGNMSAYVYAVNYNVLRVVDGYAGLLFSV
jgi:hypothetical protein